MPANLPLRIQPEESIRSYIARSLFLSVEDSSVDKILAFRNHVRFITLDLKQIADYLGWPGCYGLDRLICLHTPMAVKYLIKNSQDISYSRGLYAYGSISHFERHISYCPECTKKDVVNFGFSYWRRSSSPITESTVCPRHNILMLTHCPFCNESFSDREHGIGVMWGGCNGRYLWEVDSTPNYDRSALLQSQFNFKLCSSKYHISDEAVLSAVLRKKGAFTNLAPSCDVEFYMFENELELTAERIAEQKRNNDATLVEENLCVVNKYIFDYYDDFEDLARDIGDQGFTRPVQEGWGTYLAMGGESEWFVTEDYASGVGVFSCPYPYDTTLRKTGEVPMHEVGELYCPCCWFVELTSETIVRHPPRVLPSIPILDASRIKK
ncbi:hypothetical protein H8F21_13240 [Pseudomonas sp. P66]|uniref:TniQ protein n=1 Tax=Pseudomonas arcuscaelestis TaxID=2710591 RepID=A0ABS2BY40_9PSED|nr:hypothetical protein [Pseudomonas arcuscaelestis]MBM5458527.1 hypothetical protein [Pseudomonas arcuscaelestis]